MPRIWSNPEFIRHRRAELRPTRAITVGAVVLLLCVFIGLACWSSQQHQLLNLQQAAEEYGTDGWKHRLNVLQDNFVRQTSLLFFRWLVGLQAVTLSFWTLFSCAQSVSGERDRKTDSLHRHDVHLSRRDRLAARETQCELTDKPSRHPL